MVPRRGYPAWFTFGFALASAAVGRSAVYVVTKTVDTADGLCSAVDCSLREAVIAANTSPDADEILVPTGTYPLTLVGSGPAAGDLDLLDEVTLRLPDGAVGPAVVQAAPGWRVVRVGAVVATLSDLVLEGGSALGGAGSGTAGGGVFVADGGTLTLERCEVRDSEAAGLGGGGIYFELSASGVLVDSSVTGNSVSGLPGLGGGIRAGGLGTLTLLRTVVDSNSTAQDGAGLYARGTVSIERSALSNNIAGDDGGGIYVGGESTTVVESTIAGNEAGDLGGGVAVTGSLVVRRSLVGNNVARDGGGIYFLGAALEVEGSTFVLDRARDSGGALYLSIGTSAGIYDSTIALNVADMDGGLGSGGGIYVVDFYSPVVLHGTLIANNFDGPGAVPNDCVGEVDSLGYNLIETITGCVISGVTTGNVTGQDPVLAALSDYGGPTLTFELLPGSPALDAGDPAGCAGASGTPVAFDQRGFTRHLDGDHDGEVRCDIGAVEHSLFADGFETGDLSVWSAAVG